MKRIALPLVGPIIIATIPVGIVCGLMSGAVPRDQSTVAGARPDAPCDGALPTERRSMVAAAWAS